MALPAGVPPLLNEPTPAPAPASSGTTVSAPAKPKWGIYLNGADVVLADTVVSFEYKGESRISDYPQELGAFQSYNKVQLPFDARVMMVKSGTEADRASFLAKLDIISKSFDLYDVVTPEFTYIGASVQRYDLRRTAREGVGMITVDVWLKQVRAGAVAAFTSTASASGQDKKNVGAVQPQAPTAGQASQAGVLYNPSTPITGVVSGSTVIN